MANILFFMLPETGHLNSSLRLARTLSARDHRISYASLQDQEEYINSQGHEFVPIFKELCPKGFMIEGGFTASVMEAAASLLSSKAWEMGVPEPDLLREEIQGIIRKANPDLIIVDAYIAASLLAIIAECQAPCVLLNPTIIYPEGYEELLAPHPDITTVVLCPKEFDLPEHRLAGRHHNVEASVDLQRAEGEFPWEQLCESKKLIYCSLGTQSHWSNRGKENDLHRQQCKDFLQTVIDALSGMPEWQLVLATGNHLNAEDFHSVPSHFVIVKSVPQIEILRRASIMITHGGLNTVKECILLGVPMLVFPLWGDQLENAARVACHRLGLRGNMETASAGEISSMVEAVDSDPSFSRGVRAMRNVFRGKEEMGQAALVMESILRNDERHLGAANASLNLSYVTQ